ncbi:MAG TPA: pitrilysin family protein [Pirellulales bacterium]|nr:pitrilysin family protein [Pirellulales bacterium]
MQFREHTLSNGLEVVAECNDDARSTALGFFVKTGARDESDEIAGVSHFLEHMVFKGTPSRSADDVNRHFDEMGAHYNAFTSEESTVYYAAVLPEYQRSAVELLADILRPSLRETDFNTEKQVIIEEIKMYEDQPPFGADDRVRALHFGKHPLGRSVLGTKESIAALPVAAMREYFRRRYSPANIALVGTGKIDFDDLLSTAERCCGGWERFDTGRQRPRPEGSSQFECMHKESATQEYIIQLANGPSATDEDRFAAKVLSTIVGDDSGSRLYWSLVDPGLAESASLGHHDYDGAGLYITYLSCAPEQAEENLQRVLNLYRTLEAEGIKPEEIEQAKNKISSRVVLSSERPRGRLFNVGGNWTYRHEHRSVADDLAAIDAVTDSDLRALIAKYPLTINTSMAVGPLKNVKPPR